MKYLIEQPFKTVFGGPLRLEGVRGDPEAKTAEATIGEFLHLLLSSYTPQAMHPPLTLRDLRALNKLLDMLEEPPAQGYYAIEDADFELLLRVAPQMATLLSPRNAPLVEDALRAASKEKPAWEPAQ